MANHKISEDELLAGLKTMNAKAYEYLSLNIAPGVRAVMENIFKDKHLAEEVVSHAVYKFLEHKGDWEFESVMQVKKYLYNTAYRAGININRDNTRHKNHQEILSKMEDTATVPEQWELDEEHSREVVRVETERQINDMLARLSDRERQIIRLSVGHGLSRREVAEELGITPKTVTNIKAKAMKKLKMQKR